MSSVLPVLVMQYYFSVSDEGAFTPFEANLYLLMEWTEGTAPGKKIRKNPAWVKVKNEFSDNIVYMYIFIYIMSI